MSADHPSDAIIKRLVANLKARANAIMVESKKDQRQIDELSLRVAAGKLEYESIRRQVDEMEAALARKNNKTIPLAASIRDVGAPRRMVQAMVEYGKITVREAVEVPDEAILKLPNIGSNTLRLWQQWKASINLEEDVIQ